MISLKHLKEKFNQIKKIFTDGRRRGSKFSRPFRLVFDSPVIKRIQGYFLIVTFGATSVLVSPPSLNTAKNIEIHPEAKTPVVTEVGLQIPVEGYLSQGYHWGHLAVDIAGNFNKNIYPVTEGKVIEVKNSYWGYGKKVVIDHGNNLTSLYAHFNEIQVEYGQEVDKSTVLGTVGRTGWSTGPHLHLEIWKDNQPLNPLTVISGLVN